MRGKIKSGCGVLELGRLGEDRVERRSGSSFFGVGAISRNSTILTSTAKRAIDHSSSRADAAAGSLELRGQELATVIRRLGRCSGMVLKFSGSTKHDACKERGRPPARGAIAAGREPDGQHER